MKAYFTKIGIDKKRVFRKVAKEAFKMLHQPDEIEFYVSFVDADEMRLINNETRGVDAVTDVLSYPSLELVKGELVSLNSCADINLESGCVILGEIVICDTVAESQALMYGHSPEREFAFLFLHGLLHLLGYDHAEPVGQSEMEGLQEEILSKIGLTR